MMGAVINIGSIIGEGTMVDMNAVIGARGILGKKCSSRCLFCSCWCS